MFICLFFVKNIIHLLSTIKTNRIFKLKIVIKYIKITLRIICTKTYKKCTILLRYINARTSLGSNIRKEQIMASNYTETLKLCQWEGSDYFNHEEFNEDNLKIENAYQALNSKIDNLSSQIESMQAQVDSAKMQLLKNETIADSVEATLIFDVSNIVMTDYAYLVVECGWDNTTESASQARVKLEGPTHDSSDDYYRTFTGTRYTGSVCSVGNNYGVFFINLMNTSRIPVTNDNSAANLLSSGVSKMVPAEFETICIVGNDTGKKFTNFIFKVWGMKKW